MKKFMITLSALAVIGLLMAFTEIETLGIGKEMPTDNVEMAGIDGSTHTLNSLKGENGLLVIFSCNTCPFVVGRGDSEGWDRRYNGIYEECRKKGIGMVLINSNEAKRDNGDSMDDMVAYANERKFNMPYVLDKDHVVADAFGARTTPHIFLFGNSGVLDYKGAIDDNVDSSKDVSEHWLEDAMNALYNGKDIDPNETRNTGCSIKRVKS